LDSDQFDIEEGFSRISSNWKWLIIGGVAGAIGGLIFSLLFPPRYEAVSAIAINIDYGRTEIFELVVEDRILDRVWQLAVSDETYLETKSYLEATVGQTDSWATVGELKDHTRLDARLSRWEFIGIEENPTIAMEISNAWLTIFHTRLDEAYDHAWNAVTLQGANFDVSCVELQAGAVEEFFWKCISIDPEMLEDVADQLRVEIEASHGILPFLSFEPVQEASVPDRAVLWPRGLITFSGSAVGFILGLAYVLTRPKTEVQ
jgi:hypothetical protein